MNFNLKLFNTTETEQLKTKPSSEEIPDQMMDFLSQMENL